MSDLDARAEARRIVEEWWDSLHDGDLKAMWFKFKQSEIEAVVLAALEPQIRRAEEAERKVGELEKVRDGYLHLFGRENECARHWQAKAGSAESRLAVAVEALEKMADLPHHPATDPYVMGNMATMALARIAAMGKQEPTSEPRGVVNTPDAVPERPSAEESQVANPAGAPPSSPAPPPAERTCPKCGGILDHQLPTLPICLRCGHSFNAPAPERKEESPCESGVGSYLSSAASPSDSSSAQPALPSPASSADPRDLTAEVLRAENAKLWGWVNDAEQRAGLEQRRRHAAESRAQAAEAEVERLTRALEEIVSNFAGADPGEVDSDERNVIWSRIARKRRDIARAALERPAGGETNG